MNSDEELIELKADSTEIVVSETEAALKEAAEAVDEMTAESEVKSSEPDDFAEEMEEFEHDARDEEIAAGLSEALNRQVDQELAEGQDAEPAAEENGTEGEPPVTEPEKKPGKIPKWLKVSAIVLVALLVLLGGTGLVLAKTEFGQSILIKLGSKYAANKVNFEAVATLSPDQILSPEDVDKLDADQLDDEVLPSPTPEITEEPTPTPETELTPEPTPTPEAKLMNVLLLGEEAIGSGGSRGRTDLMIIATVDPGNRVLKLTSLMRDSFIEIPGGYSDNRINVAYSIGGVAKVYEVLQHNFNFIPDNYILVGFNSFEKVVDAVGGIDIELSANEAAYLNRTNYISNPSYRNVRTGMNHLNGNQALGYCRVRKVSTKDKQSNDFGRTARQREVLNAIFDKVKTLGYADLLTVANQCLPFVTTDLTAEQIEDGINTLLSIGGTNVNVEQMRIPYDGSWKYETIRGMAVTKIDISKNRDMIHSFIYGDQESDEAAKENAEATAEE
ncbi:MAG: LCP family protein [Lachnospiraceae bacterium]|nr:LCP family protein [Lachnospiraceae bacterium]